MISFTVCVSFLSGIKSSFTHQKSYLRLFIISANIAIFDQRKSIVQKGENDTTRTQANHYYFQYMVRLSLRANVENKFDSTL